MKRTRAYSLFTFFLAVTLSSQGKTITVNTTDNLTPGPGQTNLVRAINLLDDGDTISFNIPGTNGQVFYLQTPPGGYPIITKNNVTIDGYSQPGASANSNPIHAPNNAKIKICLDSRNGNATDMGNIELLGPPDEKYGFGHDEWAVLGVFRGTNVTFKGLGILSSPFSPAGSDEGSSTATIKSLGFARDYVGTCENWHVSGCWIGVDPADGQIKYITDGATYTNIAAPGICIAAYRHRDAAGNNAVYPQPGIIGVAAGSPNPRAEFNVIINGYGFDAEGLNYRISGNFWGVLPDGMTSADFSVLLDGAQMGDGFVEIGRDVSNCIIGTDGDGVNDADEGNVFGGFAKGGGVMLDLYSTPQTNIVIAGNWFGVAVDGVTRFTNTATIVDAFNGQSTAQFGSDFDGVSDDLEGNLVVNNSPFPDVLIDPFTSSLDDEPRAFQISVGARVSMRGNRLINNSLAPYAYADDGGDRLGNFTNYESFYMDTNMDIIPILDSTNSLYPHLKGTFAVGIAPYTNVTIDVYQLDQEGWDHGKAYLYIELTDNFSYTNGFAQGAKWIGSFPVTNNGTFDINLAGMDLGPGPVTVTANYSADPPKTHLGRTQTSDFSTPGYLLPGLAESVGLTHVVPDVACWYDKVGGPGGNGFVTNGFIKLAEQPDLAQLGNWEPYASVIGESTFLVCFGTYANDGSYANQNFCVAKQPAGGGPGTIGYGFYADDGTPFMGQLNLSRQNGNPPRVAGDGRYGATRFISEAETSIGQLAPFQTVSRWGNNDIYQGSNRYVSEQIFNLNPLTLAQTPVTNAWEYVYGAFTGSMGAGNNAPQCSRTGGRPNFLDNGNIVVMIDDKTAISSTAGEVTTFTIIDPTGKTVKGPTLVDPEDIWDNMCAYRGGFAIRVHSHLYFFDNAGNLQHSNDVNVSSGLAFGTGREDASRIASDIRSSYVYLGGQVPENASGQVWVAIWDARTGDFVAKAQVTDGDPDSGFKTDRVTIAVDARDRFCVVYPYQPTGDFPFQIAARVMAFDGVNITSLTHSFYPFVNALSDPATAGGSGLSFSGGAPSVAMTTRAICIAAKGTINSTNNPASGADSQPQQTVYTVISHPFPQDAPQPEMTVTEAGGNVTISWPQDAGLFALQSSASLTKPITWNDVSPQPATAGPANGRYTMTLPSTGGNVYFQLVRRW